MKRHQATLCALISLFLTACDQRVPGSSGNGSFGSLNSSSGGLSDDFAGGFTGGSNDNLAFGYDEESGTVDLSSGFEAAANSLEQSHQTLQQTSGADPVLIQGLDLAMVSLDRLAQAATPFRTGLSPAQVFSLIPSWMAAKQHAQETARRLWEMGLTQLSHVFSEEAAKVEVFRFYNPTTVRHYFTTSQSEGTNLTALHGFVYEGVAFRTYRAPRNGCERKLYRCYVDSKVSFNMHDHFLTANPNECSHPQINFVRNGHVGYVCPAYFPYAVRGIHRLYSRRSNHLATVNQQEAVHLVANQGWVHEGLLGYAPN